MPPSEPPLLVEDVSFAWPNGRSALHRCRMCVPRPGLWMLVGSNGSGKSTLLRLIAGLLIPSHGRITTPNKPALVFQNPDHQLLLPSCGTDLLLGMPVDLPRHERRARIHRCLVQVGLAGMERRPIHTLSGGQKQRLAIAGALAGDASLLLLDEPTALLDPTSQQEILQLIRRFCSRAGNPITALWITHRLEELDACDGAARMVAGQVEDWMAGVDLRHALTPLPAGGDSR